MEKECCPRFDPAKWDEKTFHWKGKRFIKESIPQLFHIPFFPMIGKKITKMNILASAAGKIDKNKDQVLILFHDPNPFRSEIFFSVTGEVPHASNVKISGIFISKTFAGPYNSVPKFVKLMDEYLARQEKKARDYYIHYAYCPGCAKKYGANYMILFAEI
ncbi:MAG: hypothetical protein HGA85_00630 [Nanoarchaeota archaeon]|nr:hypothetical protein [Nanoarchaeota archaeon]